MSTPEQIQYKGYVGVVEYQSDTHSFAGHVEGTRDVVTFHGGSLDELQREMAASLDHYLAWCKEHGIEPRREETADEGQITLRALLVYFNRRLRNQNPARQGTVGGWLLRLISVRLTPRWLRRLLR